MRNAKPKTQLSLQRQQQLTKAVRPLIEFLESRVLLTTTYSIAPNPGSVNEGSGSLTFTITRSGTLPAETIFASTTQDQGYTNSSDYTGLLNQGVAFTLNQTQKTVTVSITNDTTVESNETFGLIVQRNTSDPLSTFLAKTTFTIIDDDTLATSYSISPNPGSVNEGAGSLSFTVTRSGGLPAESVYASTTQDQGYTNSGDYTGLLNQSVSFAQNQTQATVSVSITNDTTVESNETFGLIVQRNTSDPLTTYLAKTTFTIIDNDTLPTTYAISPNPATVNEGDGSLSFTVTRSGGLPAETIYASTAQTEGYTNSGDYTGVSSQNVAFSANQTQATVTVSITNDTTVESNETFGLIVQRNSSDPVTTYLAKTTFTIIDNDTLPTTYAITPNPASVNEGSGSLSFTVTRSGGLPAETVYASTTQDQGYTNSSDYTGLLNQNVSFAQNQTQATVSVSITNDTTVESNETFGLIVQRNTSDPLSTFLAKTTFTIIDDDTLATSYSISPNPGSVNEGAGSLSFTVTRSGGLPAETIFASTTQDQGYTNSSDYTGLLNQNVSFALNQTQATVTVSITNDTTVENNETFGLVVQRNSTDPLTTFLAKTTFTIIDNDTVTAAPSISSVSPTSMPSSTSDQTLTINGSSFVNGATLTFDPPTGANINSSAAKLTFNSSGQIIYRINNGSDVGTWAVRVNNPDGQTSGWTSFTVTSVAASPSINSVSPNSMLASNGDQSLTINGTNFVNGATLTFDPPTGANINSSAAKLTFVNSGQINYQINNGSDVGTWTVKVNNPDGQSSGIASFTVTATSTQVLPPVLLGPGDTSAPGSNLADLTPTFQWQAASGATGYGLYIRDLTTGLLVYPNSTGTTSTPLTGTALTLPAGILQQSRQYKWNMTSFVGTVEQTPPSGNPSRWFQATAATNAPTISSVNPDPVTGSATSQPFHVYGSGFTNSSTIRLRDLDNDSPSQFYDFNQAGGRFLYHDSAHIEIQPVFTTTAARWSAEVINSDGTSSGQRIFNVQLPSGGGSTGIQWFASPYYSSRAGRAIDTIVLHTTEGGTFDSNINYFRSNSLEVSAHYLISSTGQVAQLVHDEDAAHHATYYNSRAIGIEVVGYAGDPNTWTTQAVDALEKLVASLAIRYGVSVVHPGGNAYDYPGSQFDGSGIVAHSQIQPWNRSDPGQYFPWASFLADVQQRMSPGGYVDTSPPASASNVTITPGAGTAHLTWQLPGDAAGVVIVRRADSLVVNGPTSGTQYAVGATLGGGTVVFSGAGTSYVDSGLSINPTYYYSLYAYDAAKNYAPAATASARQAATVETGFQVSGRVRYRDYRFGATGYIGTSTETWKDVRYATVELFDAQTNSVLARTFTGIDGRYTFSGLSSPIGSTLKLRVKAETEAGTVKTVNDKIVAGSTFEVVGGVGVNINGSGIYGIDADIAGPNAGAWNILDMLVVGYQAGQTWISEVDSLKNLTVLWDVTGAIVKAAGQGPAYYEPSNRRIILTSAGTPGADNDFAYSDTAILHEYGHFVTDVGSVLNSAGGKHGWDSGISQALAWNEGLASFYAVAAIATASTFVSCDSSVLASYFADPAQDYAVDLESRTFKAINGQVLASPSAIPARSNVEGSVAAALWDLYDVQGTNDPGDTYNASDGASKVFATIDTKLKSWISLLFKQTVTIRDFYDGWLDKYGSSETQSIKPIFVQHTPDIFATSSVLADFAQGLFGWAVQNQAQAIPYGLDGNEVAEIVGSGQSSISRQVTLPSDTATLDFDYNFVNVKAGDRLALLINGTEVWSVLGTADNGNSLLSSGPIGISAYAGQAVQIEFRFSPATPGATGDVSSVWLDNVVVHGNVPNVVTGPQIVSWASANDHARAVGEVALTIPDDGTFSEPRDGGIHRVLITFNGAVNPLSFVPGGVKFMGNDVNGSALDLSGITVTTGTRNGNTVGVIEFSQPLPDYARYLIRVTGVTDVAGNLLNGDSDVVLTALRGDVSGDRRVNVTDLSYISAHYADPIINSDVAQARADVNMDGRANVTDLSRSWVQVNHNAQTIPDPVLPVGAALFAASASAINLPTALAPLASAGTTESAARLPVALTPVPATLTNKSATFSLPPVRRIDAPTVKPPSGVVRPPTSSPFASTSLERAKKKRGNGVLDDDQDILLGRFRKV